MIFALAGKGGTGKTTLAGLIVRYLKRQGRTPILAVDADPNANLNEALGLEVSETVGAVRDDMLKKAGDLASSSVPKETYLEYRLQESLVEAEGYDLLVMGRPEGPGCYCYANTILRKYLDILSKNYPHVVMDNEAGMEHLSRTTTQDVDVLLIVSDPTARGVRAAGRIRGLAKELGLKVGRFYLVINRADGELPSLLTKEIEKAGVPLLGVVPVDEAIVRCDLEGSPLLDLPDDSPAVGAVARLMDEIEKHDVKAAAN